MNILQANDRMSSRHELKDKHIFILDEHNRFFSDNGYCVLPKFCSSDVIHQLLKLYSENYNSIDGMYVTHTTNDFKKNKNVCNQIFKILGNNLQLHFTDIKQVLAHFAVKNKNGNNFFNLHQDYSIVEEQKFGIAHIWIALNDINSNNGGLMLIPKSHKIFNNYRSGTFGINFISHKAVEKKIINFDIKAGDAIIYHPAVFHGSPENNSGQDRIAVIAAVANVNATLCYFQKTSDGVEVYELTEEDIFGRLSDLAQGKIPKGKFLRKESQQNTIGEEIILERISALEHINQ